MIRKLSSLVNFYRLFEADSELLGPTLNVVCSPAVHRRTLGPGRGLCASKVMALNRAFVRACAWAPCAKQIFSAASTPWIPGASMVKTTMVTSLRRRACSILVLLASEVPAALLPYFPTLASSVQQRFDAGDATESEKTFLLEALVLVSHAVPSPTERQSFLATVCRPIMADMADPQLAAVLADATSFMQGIGFDALFRLGTAREELVPGALTGRVLTRRCCVGCQRPTHAPWIHPRWRQAVPCDAR